MSSKIADIRQSYVDGRFVTGDGEPLAVENPATEEVIAEVETLSLAQMEEAVLAARRAFDGGAWSGLRREERIDAVLALGEYLAGRSEELGATLTAEAGATASMMGAQVGMPLAHLRAACDIYRTMPDVEHTPRPLGEVILGNRVTASMMRYEPIGVVSAIAAYNFPLQTPLWKFVPALLTGSTVIVRPSPLTPIATLVLGEAAEAVGLPAGVLNVVVEGGVEGGQLLSSHPAVDCVSFTGSTAVGRSIMAQASPTVKRVLLELGGKSVQLYLADAVERAPMGCATVFAAHSGQACVAPTRMLVPEDRKAEVLEKAAGVAGMLKVGDPSRPRHDDRSGHLGRPARALRALRRRRGRRRRDRGRAAASDPPTGPTGLLLRADRARRARQLEPGGAGRDLRAGDLRDRLPRRRPRGRDRQRLGLRPRRARCSVATSPPATSVAERIRAGAVQRERRLQRRVRALRAGTSRAASAASAASTGSGRSSR